MAAKTLPRVNPKSVTILAMGPTTMQYISQIGGQFERPTKHVWAINNAGMWFHDIDLIIAMDDFKRDSKTHPKYVKALTNRGVPILTCTTYETYPSQQEYPTVEVMVYLDVASDWAPHPLDNSCNYALAYAMYRGMKEIHLYGYEFRAPITEKAYMEAQKYAMEKYGRNTPDWFGFYMKPWLPKAQEPGEESCHWLLGLCHGRGIKVRFSENTTLVSASLPRFYYGYTQQPDI